MRSELIRNVYLLYNKRRIFRFLAGFKILGTGCPVQLTDVFKLRSSIRERELGDHAYTPTSIAKINSNVGHLKFEI